MLGANDQALPAAVVEGAPVRVQVGGEPVMTGLIDEIEHQIDKMGHSYRLCGRDGAAVLVDCAAPIFVGRQVGLADVAAKIVRPLGITKIRVDADVALVREKVNVEPGDTAWAALSNLAEANGLWPWFEPDGTLVIGGPDYTAPVVAQLVLRRSGRGNNIERLERRSSIARRFSAVTVLGQSAGTASSSGKNALMATATDTSMTAYRPHVVVDHECDSVAVCLARARKLLADGRLEGMTLLATVRGPRIVAPGQAADGKLWAAGQRVHVLSEPHGIDAPFFVMGRRMSGGRGQPAVTVLTLKEDGVWVLDAHPHKHKHRRGKNDSIMRNHVEGAA
jgi:prophage tail gpP-like protein